MKCANRQGFTLIELLITVTLVSLIGATGVAAVSGCLRVWGKVSAHGDTTSWAEVTFEGIRRDLHNIKTFTPIAFDGEYDAIRFPTVVRSALSNGEEISEIGQAGYYFDSQHRRLCRAQFPYRLMRRIHFKDQCDAVMNNVSRVRFSYFRPKTDTSEGGWGSSWEAAEPPIAVKVEVNYDERTVGKVSPQVLLVHVPLAAQR